MEPIRSGATLADLRIIVQAFPHIESHDTAFEDDVMGVILDCSEIIAMERNRGVVENLVAGREK